MSENKYKIVVDGLTAIKYEEQNEFLNSVSVDAYRKAKEITEKILKENKNFRELKNSGVTGNKLRNSEQIYNILFFTGAKGSGKTSTMLSYMEFLKDYYRKKEKCNSEFKLVTIANPMFTGLEYIDASVMDRKEDILGCILSKMLKKWKEEELRSYENQRMGIIQTNDYSYRKRSISMAFDRVYTNLKNLRSSKDVIEDEDDTFLETLEKLSLSWNLKESFQELVEKYLEIMKYPDTESLKIENHFLVISIDEADMNIEHGFEIIEQIRQYLMGPNIIVLLSADYAQLEKICNNHYSREFSATNKFENMEHHIKRLTREYLEKIIPSDRRIFMPSGNEWKLLDKEQIEVYYNEDKEENYAIGTIREIIQTDCKKYLGIELYKDGDLIKFFTPDTLREFSVWIKKMNEFLCIENEDPLLRKKKVYEWFWEEKFPSILKKENISYKLYSSLNDLKPYEQIDLMKNKLMENIKSAENNTDNILEMISLLKTKDVEERKLSTICSLFLSMQMTQMINENKNKEYLKYFSQCGLWGNWEEKMGFEYVIKELGKLKIGGHIQCINFSELNSALELQVAEFADESNKSSEIIKSEMIKMENFQYIILFFGIPRGLDENENPWEVVTESHSIRLKDEYRTIWSRNGIFSFSNAILNVLKGCKLTELFCKCIEMKLKGNNISNKKAKGTADSISIFSTLAQTNRMLIPIYNIEFLIKLGKELESAFMGGPAMELSLENVSILLVRYCKIIKENLKKYDQEFFTDYENCFSEFGLFKKILNNDPDFMELFYETIRKLCQPEEIGLSD